jgi:HK97 family phage portal protein
MNRIRSTKIYQTVTSISPNAPIYPDVNYRNLSMIGYKQNVYVYRCVNLIANTASSIPIRLYKKDSDNRDIQVESHPALDLLKKPNEFQGQTDFIKGLFSYLEISGNTYVQGVTSSRSSQPRELFLIRPDMMKIVKGSTAVKPIAGYEYTYKGLNDFIPYENTFHGKLFNPLDDPIIGYGQAPLETALRSIVSVNKSIDWNNSLLKNYARPSGLMIFKQGLTKDQRDEMENEIETKHQGSGKVGKPWIMEGDVDWKQIGLNNKELMILDILQTGSRQICVTYGIDSSLISDPTNKTYSNFKESRAALYEDVILPLLDWFRDDFLNGWLLPKFPNTENYYFDYSTDDIEALNEERTIVYERNIRAFKEGVITLNEAREALGYSELIQDEQIEEDGEEQTEDGENKEVEQDEGNQNDEV